MSALSFEYILTRDTKTPHCFSARILTACGIKDGGQ